LGIKEHFSHIINKFQEKLVGWKVNLLTKGGKLILIKHVLSSLPLYAMGMFDLLKAILESMNNIISNFF
jgi:hypothetical protein